MKILRASLIGALLLLSGKSLVFGQLPDPREILTKSKAAIQNLRSISYHAEYYVIGTIKYGDTDAILTPKQGDVTFMRIPEDQFFGGKLCVQRPNPLAKSSAVYKIVYDGQKIMNIGEEENTVFVNDLDQSGKFLLSRVFELVASELREPNPFSDVQKAEKIRYSGKAFVGGVACHIVQVGFSGDSSVKERIWFIAADDYLPRKVQKVGFGLPNQEITQVLTITDLKVNPEIDATKFVVDAPEGFSVKRYQLPDHPNAPGLALGSLAPGWTLRDASGKVYSLQGFKGKLAILDFWATWCGPCRQAMPALQKLSEKYGKRGVVIVGISTWESGDPARFMKDHGFSYLLLLDGNEVAKSYHVSGLPTLYIIGSDGKILFGEVGIGSESSPEKYYLKLEQVIVSSLKKM
jgi:thiol-disulfide isomerase/thioredoxin/outer membrane lipoprotein-sorting protein